MTGRCKHCSCTSPRNYAPSASSHMHTSSFLDALEAVLKLCGLSSSFGQLKPHKAHGHRSGQTPTRPKKPVRPRPGLCMSVCVPVWSSQKGLIQTDCNRREQMAVSSAAKSILLLLCCFCLQAGVFSPTQRG